MQFTLDFGLKLTQIKNYCVFLIVILTVKERLETFQSGFEDLIDIFEVTCLLIYVLYSSVREGVRESYFKGGSLGVVVKA